MRQKFLCSKVCTAILCLAMNALPLFADTIYVPSQYPTIQQGLNAAQSGDTVMVAAGTYPENITWPTRDAIVLISEDGPQTTIIDGSGTGRVINFPSFAFSQNTQIIGFTVQNGKAIQSAGILVNGSPYIYDNIIQRNIAEGTETWVYGGGIFCDGTGSPQIVANTIRGNVAKGEYWNYGAGIYVDGQNSAFILGNTIENDSAIGGSWNYGAGIYCDGQSQPDIRHNIIQNNVAYQGSRGHGVGIYVDMNCNAYILSNLIYSNTAQSGSWNYGAGILVNSGAEVINNTIVGNSCIGGAWRYGGGIFIYDSTNTIGNNIIVNNTAGSGGGIYCSTLGHATLLNNDVWNNTGGNYSGIAPGANDISQDALFVTGPLGDFYLSQTAAGQGQDSPCVDYGYTTAANLELDTFTTRTDSVYDTGVVDLGYHYPVGDLVYVEEQTEYHEATIQKTLFQVFPTFSSSSYKVQLVLSSPQYVELCIFDGLGRLQQTLFKGKLASGKTEWTWNGLGMDGHKLASGVYFFVAEVGHSERLSEKVILLK